MKIKAVIFDMDGVLVNTTELVFNAMRDVLAEHGVEMTRKQLAEVTGKPVPRMYEELAPHLDSDELEKAHLAHHEENMHLLAGYEGVHETLSSLKKKGYKLGVFTGFNKLAYDRLDRFELQPYFDAIVECTMYTAHKPDPEGLLLCMDKMGISDAGEVAYIGDGVSDVAVGRNAKVAKVFAITYGFSTREALAAAKPDYLVDSLPEFEKILDKIE